MQITLAPIAVAILSFNMLSGVILSTFPTLLRPRSRHFAVPVNRNNDIYVFGGGDTAAALDSEVYNPELGSRRVGSPARYDRSFSFALLLQDGRVLACDPCQLYSPRTNVWEPVSIRPAGIPPIQLGDGRIVRTGVVSSIPQGVDTFVYDPVSFTETRAGPLSDARNNSLAVVALRNGGAFIAGGHVAGLGGGRGVASAEMLDPLTLRWRRVAPMSRARPDARAVLLRDGRVLVVDRTDAEMYDSVIDRWTVMPTFAAPLGSAVDVLPNGQVLISGGGERDIARIDQVLFDPVRIRVRQGRSLRNQGEAR
jgi:hypothetical protein